MSHPSAGPSGPAAGENAFEELFRRTGPRVYAYAARHVGFTDADDIVADTFLAAWRRRGELPADPLPWLLVTARHTIANRHRGRRRADRLWQAAVNAYWHTAPGADEAVLEKQAMIAALGACTEAEREAMLLIAWDGLTYADAARVLGCTERALTVRISRGRARLTQNLRSADHPDAIAMPHTLIEDTP